MKMETCHMAEHYRKSVGGSDYLPQISLKSVQYSREVIKMPMLAKVET